MDGEDRRDPGDGADTGDRDVAGDLTFRDRALLVGETLVVADLHVGWGAASDVSFPVGDGSEMVERLRDLVESLRPDEVVVAGDLLHSFRTVPRTVERTVAGLAGAAREAGAGFAVVPGNHDTMLDAVWSGPVHETYRVGDTVVCHGHEPPGVDADRYVVGHDHPTITIEGQRRPCYLVGRGVHRGANVVVLPAFNRLLRGVEINRMRASEFMSPLIEDADAFAPVVLDGREPLRFPPLGKLRRRL